MRAVDEKLKIPDYGPNGKRPNSTPLTQPQALYMVDAIEISQIQRIY